MTLLRSLFLQNERSKHRERLRPANTNNTETQGENLKKKKRQYKFQEKIGKVKKECLQNLNNKNDNSNYKIGKDISNKCVYLKNILGFLKDIFKSQGKIILSLQKAKEIK